MTTLTQKIPNLLGGISQQPDVKKFPGEVRTCINAFPEYALGLMKRPGSKVEALLRGSALPGASAATPSGQSAVTRHYGATEKWFDINVDGVPYVGQINDYHYGLQGTIVGGSGYTDEIYNNVPLTGGTGSGATANITVSGNAVTAVEIVNHGTGYATGDVLSADDSNLGGGGGSNFTFTLTRGSTDHLSLQLWFKDSGIPRAVNLDNYMEASYISSGSWSNYQTQINAEAGALVAKIGGLSTFQTEQKNYYTNYQNTIDNLNNIFRVDTTYDRGEVFQFIYNGVLQDENDNISFITDGEVMTGNMPISQATGDVILQSSTLTTLALTASGSGYQNSAQLGFNGSGTNAAGTLTLSNTGSFVEIDVDNPGLGYTLPPLVSISSTVDPAFAAKCHPKARLTTDGTGKVRDIQLNYGKEIRLETGKVFFEEIARNESDENISVAELDATEVLMHQGTGTPIGPGCAVTEYSGLGTGDHLSLAMPEAGIHWDTSSHNRPRIIIKGQDLTNVHTIRVYGVTGDESNGGPLPQLQTTWVHKGSNPEWVSCSFVDENDHDVDDYTNISFDRDNSYLLRNAHYDEFTFRQQPSYDASTWKQWLRDHGPQSDSLPKYIGRNHLSPEDRQYGYTDVVVPAEWKKANVNLIFYYWGRSDNGRYALSTVHLLETLPATLPDSTLTLTNSPIKRVDCTLCHISSNNPLQDNPAPTTEATARLILNKSVSSVTLDNVGSGYQDGVQTTTTVSAPCVDKLILSNPGHDYETAPTIDISGNATAALSLTSNGRFKRFDVTNQGSGYTSVPTVTLGGSLAGREATATVVGNQVTEITLTPQSVDTTALNTVHSLIDNAAVRAAGNGTETEYTGTDHGSAAGGFNVGSHIKFGVAQNGGGHAGLVTNAFNTVLCDRIRLTAICGQPDGSNGGGFERNRGNDNLSPFAPWPTGSNWISHSGVLWEYQVVPDGGTFDATDESLWTSGGILIEEKQETDHPVGLTTYTSELPVAARNKTVHIRLRQYYYTATSSPALTVLAEIGITKIELLDAIDYKTPQNIEDTATVTFTGGGGVDAAASMVLGHQVESVSVTAVGSGYTAAPVVSFSGGSPATSAVAAPLISGTGATVDTTFTQVFEGDITDPGLGYLSATGTLSGGGGSGATATISALNGKVSHIAVTGGNGLYTSNPTLAISAPDLSGGTSFPRFASNDEFDEFVEQGTGDVFKIGIERTDDYPILIDSYPKGYKVWEILSLDRADDPDGTALRAYETNTYDPAEDTYDNLVTAYNTAITNTDNAYPTFDTTKLPLNGASNYFVDDVVGGGAKVDLSELKIVTFQDTTFILNPRKKVEYTTDKTPIAKFDEGFIFFKVLSNGDFEVKITLLNNDADGNEPHEDGYTRTIDTTFATSGVLTGSSTHNSSTNTVEEHLTDLETSFTSGYTDFSNDFDFIQSGNGIYIATKGALANRQFELVVSGPTEDSIDTLRHEINDISQLPIQLKEGYKVKVVNSLQANADDFYVTFRTEESGNDYSGGTWEESNGRDIPYKIDANTMPHALTVNSDGSFSFGPWPHWDERQVGDELTNPTPEFITTTGANRYIKDMFVYRNRLGFLSQDYVSLSRAGEFFNFFTKSAIAGADDDPINISVSDVDTPNLAYVSKEAAGLLIFGDTGQYLLSTDSDVLAPTTAKINKVSGFKSDIKNPSLSLGGTTAFVSKTVSSTKMFELLKVSSIQPPDVIEQSRTVPELIPTTVDSIVGSPDLGLVSFGTIGTTDLYHFNYLRVGDREIGSAWYQWELPGNLLHQFFDTNEYHAVIRTDTNDTVTVSFDVAQTSIAGVLTLDSGKKTDLVLDVYDDKPLITYTGINAQGILEDKTKIYLPTGKINNKKLVVVMYSNRSQIFDEEAVTMTEHTDPIHGKYIEVDGDWRGSDVFVGYKYNMSVELPRFYFKRVQNEQINTDVDADLIIHKLKVKTGLTGPITYKINIVGIPERSSTYTITPSGQYNLDEVNMTETGTHVVPVYQRNDNTIVTIESNTAFPATIESINWEGRYATNFYRRA